MEENIGIHILYKDNQFIIMNKPGGLLVRAQGGDKEKSLLQLAAIYCKHPVGVTHQLDRPVSGVCVMTKNKKAQAYFNDLLKEGKVEKKYWAVVPKGDLEKEGELIHYLKRNGKTKKSEISDVEKKDYKKAVMKYKIIGEIDNYFLLEVELLTGRFHQIRVQLSAIGFPIKGDVKYGARRGNKDRTIHLHAKSVAFIHPTKKEMLRVESPKPDDSVWNAFG